MIRSYIVPEVQLNIFGIISKGPKYSNPDALIPGWKMNLVQAVNYGLESVWFIACDVTPAEHSLLNAQADVIVIPAPLTDTVSVGALNTVKTKLETLNIPAHYVTVNHTWKQVLFTSMGMAHVMQRFHKLFGRLFQSGVTLDTRVNQLPLAARNALISAAQDLRVDVTGIVGVSLLRDALLTVGTQIAARRAPGSEF